MCPAQLTTPIAYTRDPLAGIDTDLIVVPWFEGEPPTAVADLDAASGGEIARAIGAKEFQSKPYELFLTQTADRGWRARRIALIGAGRRADFSGDVLRKVAAAAGVTVRQRRIARVAFVVRGPGDLVELAQAAAEGLTLSEFNGGSYKKGEPAPALGSAWTISVPDAAGDRMHRRREAARWCRRRADNAISYAS